MCLFGSRTAACILPKMGFAVRGLWPASHSIGNVTECPLLALLGPRKMSDLSPIHQLRLAPDGRCKQLRDDARNPWKHPVCDLYSPADPNALEQARADLGIVTSRSNAGGVQAVQWSLPG